MGVTPADLLGWAISITPQLANGATAGSVAVAVYFLKKRWESQDAARSATRILYNEIRQNVQRLELGYLDASMQFSRRPPSVEVYIGLLHTGNIRYFDDDVQKNLDDLYCAFRADRDNLPDLLKAVSQDLEELTHASRTHRIRGFLGALGRPKGRRRR